MGRQLWLSMDIDDYNARNNLAYYQTMMKQQCNGDWEEPSAFHITIDFLGEDETDYDKAEEAMHIFHQRYNKYDYIGKSLYGNLVNTFEGGVLWIGVDNSWLLYDIRYKLREIYTEVGYTPAPDKFKGYTPHITMAYNIDMKPSIEMKPVTIPLTNISLWNSFKVNDAYVDNVLYSIR